MNQLEKIYRETPKISPYAKGYLEYLKEVLGKLDEAPIAAFTESLLKARDRGARIFFIGNGGSAATASHFANDLSIGTQSWKRPFRVISLTDNLAVITAIANDRSYDDIFLEQLKAQLSPGDVVVAISASGNSPNVVKAIEYANTQGAVTVGLTGFDGGKLRQISQIGIHSETNKGEYGPVEDVHLIVNHLIGSFLMLSCRSEK